jgi:hypothetical protein
MTTTIITVILTLSTIQIRPTIMIVTTRIKIILRITIFLA